jgi:hypothetical protein
MAESTPQVEFGGNYHTSQIYSRGFEFAFLARPPEQEVYRQATTFVYCKDFLHDAIWAFLHQTRVQIYNFHYDCQTDLPLEMGQTVLACRNLQYRDQPEEFHNRREACLEFLQGIDRQLGFQPTEIFQVENADGPCWVFFGDKRWQLAAPLLSLYTLLIRIGFFHHPGDDIATTLRRSEQGEIQIGPDGNYAGHKDNSYIKQAHRGIEIILTHGVSIFHPSPKENYPREVNTQMLHDNFGIVKFTLGRPKELMPYWYREELWK